MRMTESQLEQYRRDGYFIFPSLFSAAEIAVLRAETARLSAIEADTVIRERTGGVRSIFRVHEADGARARADAAGARHRGGLYLSHQDQYQAGDRRHGVDVAPGLRLVAARRLHAARHGYVRADDDRLDRDERRALRSAGEPPTGPHRAVLRREHVLQVLGGGQARHDRGAALLAAAGADRRTGRHLRRLPLQPAPRLGPQPVGRRPLA